MFLHSYGRLLALPTNIRLRYKRVVVQNTLAYYDPATITSVKRFIVEAKSQFVFTLFLQSDIFQPNDFNALTQGTLTERES